MDNLISIIVPIYNVEKYLEQCLESIYNQSYLNFEAILVDDGSCDSSASICQKYMAKDSRFKYYYKQNGGLSDARNYGVFHAKGQYITFLDSDDYIDKEYLTVLYNNLIKNDVDISVVNYRRIDDTGKIYKEIFNKKDRKISNYEALENIFYQKNISISACGKLFKKNIVISNKYPKGLLYEDIYTVPRFFSDSKNVFCSSKTLLNYRIRAGSITQSEFKKNDFDMINNTINVFNYLKKTNSDFTSKSIYSYIFSKASTLIFLINNSEIEYSEQIVYCSEIWKFIKKYRNIVLFDRKSRIMNKIGALASFFGLRFFVFLHKFK